MDPARAAAVVRTAPVGLVRDVISLTKPRITAMVVFTTLGGYWLGCRYLGIADTPLSGRSAVTIPLLVGTALVVAGANALNMYLERDTDGLMARTRGRPLPTGRLAPEVALALGLFLGAVSIPWLAFAAHPVTGLLAAIAFASYVGVYTPLKRRTPWALLVGAVPGAIPPLLGWSAANGTVDGPGIVLFAILFLWQIPHFLAIATFRKDEYARAGMRVLPVVVGDRITRHHVVRYLAALVLASLLLAPYGIGGDLYLGVACALGALFFGVGAWGLKQGAGPVWGRWLFVMSMVYLAGIFIALSVGRDAWM
jgi:protoheme IX farnesyltransferase